MMRYDLKKPCKNCPFADTEHRIVFACRERAEEIAETAYRNGFPCHLSAEHIEEEDDPIGGGGFYAGSETQHCAGALMMFMWQQEYCWPGVDNDEDLVTRLWDQLDFDNGRAFQSEEEFIEANQKP